MSMAVRGRACPLQWMMMRITGTREDVREVYFQYQGFCGEQSDSSASRQPFDGSLASGCCVRAESSGKAEAESVPDDGPTPRRQRRCAADSERGGQHDLLS